MFELNIISFAKINQTMKFLHFKGYIRVCQEDPISVQKLPRYKKPSYEQIREPTHKRSIARSFPDEIKKSISRYVDKQTNKNIAWHASLLDHWHLFDFTVHFNKLVVFLSKPDNLILLIIIHSFYVTKLLRYGVFGSFICEVFQNTFTLTEIRFQFHIFIPLTTNFRFFFDLIHMLSPCSQFA